MTDERKKRRQQILAAYAKRGTIAGTLREIGGSINTVRRVLRGQDLLPPAKPAAPKPSLLDPFRPVIQRLVLEDQLTAVLVLEELQRLGFEGHYSILKDYVRQIRPRPRVKVTTRLDHAPGACGQVDWSPYRVTLGSEERIVHAFSMVLPFSRYMVVRFALDETLDTLIALHDEAFAELHGVLTLMTYDNMTTVGRHVGKGEVWINPRFEAYAKGCGFDIHLIDPGCPDQHGSVERPMHYIEHNCLRRRRFRFADLADLNTHAKWWCEHVANVRQHGTTRERPVDRLLRERPYFRPLPSARPEPCRLLSRQVGSDFCVPVDTNRYSVPPQHAKRPATVRLYVDRLEILVAGDLVAVHPLCHQRYQRKVLPEHEEAFKRCTPSRRLLEQAFLRLGPTARHYYEGLRTQRGRGAGYHLQRILKLADRHGSTVVQGAMAHAARYGNYSAEAIARVLSGRELRDRTAAHGSEPAAPPERVRRWLEGLDVESVDLADYDRLVDRETAAGEPTAASANAEPAAPPPTPEPAPEPVTAEPAAEDLDASATAEEDPDAER